MPLVLHEKPQTTEVQVSLLFVSHISEQIYLEVLQLSMLVNMMVSESYYNTLQYHSTSINATLLFIKNDLKF